MSSTENRATSARAKLREVELDSSEEDLFLAGMIVSDEFLSGISHVMEPRYFKSPHIRIVSGWVLEFYDEFQIAPGPQIREIYEIEKRNEEVADSDLIEKLLCTISERYADKEFNAGYMLPKMINYIRERVVEITLEDAKWNLKKKGPDSAWETLHKITDVRRKTSTGHSLFGEFEQAFESWYYKGKEELFRFPGALGYYMAPLLRKKLIAYMAPPKRGKSWWLLFSAITAVMNKLNVAVFSLEMDRDEVIERLVMMLLAREVTTGANEKYMLPVVDCIKNQNGTCEKACRTSAEEAILDDDGNTPEYFDFPHTTCEACRPDWENDYRAGNKPTDFEYAPWMEEITKASLSPKEVRLAFENFKMHFGEDSLKIFTHRINTLTVKELEEELDEQERLFGWVPDVLVIDYADIMKKEGYNDQRRMQLGNIWENLSGITKERNVLTFTASQGNRGSTQKTAMDQSDIAEDFSKVMVVDGLITINENNLDKVKVKKDKYWQRQVLQWIAHRYKRDLKEWEKCVTLNCLSLGQIALDSEIIE